MFYTILFPLNWPIGSSMGKFDFIIVIYFSIGGGIPN